jgi:DNA processing protein
LTDQRILFSMSEQNPNILWLAASMAPNVGPTTLRRHWKKVPSITAVWEQLDLPPSQKDRLIAEAGAEYELATSLGIDVLNPSSFVSFEKVFDGYDCPLVVFAKGRIDALYQPVVAVVGSREANDYGREVAEYIVGQLVAQQCVIASGMAQGIDTIAHRTALQSGGTTIAVMGSSLDAPQNDFIRLAHEIGDSGLLLSQFRSGTQPQRFTFPARNRLIAAISRGVVVVQARRDSGSLLTARAATQYGKPVFAVPGNIFDGRSIGVHELIGQGAILAVDGIGIVKSLGFTPHTAAAATTIQDSTLSDDERGILKLFEVGPLHIDQVIRASRIEAARVLSLVSRLEIEGWLRQIGPGEYRRGDAA